MNRSVPAIAALLIAACGQQSGTGGDSAETVKTERTAAANCAAPTLALPNGAQLKSSLLKETAANFAAAHKNACDKGLLGRRPLIDAKAADRERLLLINAPEANVASIYFSEIDGNRMVLEYPFLTTDGKTHVPSADELQEAIYCAVRGATAEEQAESGRCLPD